MTRSHTSLPGVRPGERLCGWCHGTYREGEAALHRQELHHVVALSPAYALRRYRYSQTKGDLS